MRQRQFIVALGWTPSLVFCLGAAAQDALPQEGHHGVSHDKWHRDFYAMLRRNDGGGPCCSMTDCRPTQSRKVKGHYEVIFNLSLKRYAVVQTARMLGLTVPLSLLARADEVFE
jgi:hypothetical protein